MAVYHGRKGVVYMSTTGSGDASSVIKLNMWTLNMSTDVVETTSYADSNKTYVQGLPDAQGRFGGFFDNSESKLFTGRDSADGVKIYLYPSSDAPTIYWYGPAWVDYSVDSAVSDAVKISANFRANGAWAKKP